MLQDILAPFCVTTGYDVTKDVILALNYINRAAKEIYDGLEADEGLSEVVLAVPRNLQLTLPHYIGDLRGMREYKYGQVVPLYSIGTPRYSQNTWEWMWRNWTQKPVSPLSTSLTNAGLLNLHIPTADNTVVSIVMETFTAERIVEHVTMNLASKFTINSPTKIIAISSATQGRLYDITINDINGIEIAKLHNNQSKTRYRVIDVSEFQWTSGLVGDGVTTLMETLYKPAFVKFYNLTDEFIAEGYDDAIQYKAMEFWCYGQEGKEADAMMYARKSLQALDLTTRTAETGEVKKLQFQPNPVYQALGRFKSRGSSSGYFPFDRGY